MMKIIYFFKKMVGLTTHYDDMVAMHSTWTVGPGVAAKIVSKIASFVPSSVASLAGGVGTAPAAIFTGAKVTVIGGSLLAAAELSVSTAQTITKRTNQARAVIADTLAHPINLDKALNPAYHGKRDQLDDNLLLTANYYEENQGQDYQITPYAGYRPFRNDQRSFINMFGIRTKGRPGGSDSSANGSNQKDDLVIPKEFRRDFSLIKGIELDDPTSRFNLLAEKRAFIDSLGLNDYQDQTLNLSSITTTANPIAHVPTLTEEGAHGIEITSTVSRVIQVLHDGTVITENYTTTIKQQAFSETSYQYLLSLFNGNVVGPITYVNTITKDQGQRYTLTPQRSFLERVTGAPNPARDYYGR